MSGEIDFVEFLIFISATSSGNIEDKLRVTFTIYDINKDNKVEKHELLKLVKAIYELRGEHKLGPNGLSSPEEIVDKIMIKFGIFQNLYLLYLLLFILFSFKDKNKDGYLSESSFIDGCMSDDFLKNLLCPNLNITNTSEIDEFILS